VFCLRYIYYVKLDKKVPKSPFLGFRGGGESKFFSAFLLVIVFLALILMIVQLTSKPKFLEEKNMRLSFSAETRKDMVQFGLKVPLYAKPSGESEVIKYYENPEEKFIMIERQRKIWVKVVDEKQDTGWLSVFFLKKDLTN